MMTKEGAAGCVLPIVRQAPQILYGSTFPNRQQRMGTHDESWGLHVYQGASDFFLGSGEALKIVEGLDLDFEAELAIILDAVPQGVSACEADKYIKVLTACNDFTYRKLACLDKASGFGFVQSKPLTSFFGQGISPEENVAVWNSGRPLAELEIRLNGTLFCRVTTRDMLFGFPELVAHCARTRALPCGTIITSGSISMLDKQPYSETCLAERVNRGASDSRFLVRGDEIGMEFFKVDGGRKPKASLFGQLLNRVDTL